jgi:hypothetical protein
MADSVCLLPFLWLKLKSPADFEVDSVYLNSEKSNGSWTNLQRTNLYRAAANQVLFCTVMNWTFVLTANKLTALCHVAKSPLSCSTMCQQSSPLSRSPPSALSPIPVE